MKTRKTYPIEFRSEAVKLVLEQGLSLEGAARRLGIPKGTLANWVVAVKSDGDQSAPGVRSISARASGNWPASCPVVRQVRRVSSSSLCLQT
ncbi:hypothetical protein B0T45_20910 [Chromobacterium haemolyticum]|uniref:Transposase n=1 Tax=Chromobacterium haemolyticum TaxID=394935 RepID=A0A1W0CDX6_9NEIS|nr:hypothetical protein B0T45_20910 [Chromobacterium haemolyticum]